MTTHNWRMLSDQQTLVLAWRECEFARKHVPAFATLPVPVDTDDYQAFRTAVPVTLKADYRMGFPGRVLARSAELASPDILMSHSSGTGGDRLTSASRLYDLSARQAATMRAHPQFANLLASISRQRVCRYAAPNCSDVECANPLSTVEGRTLRDGTLVLPVAHDLFTTREPMVRQAIDEILTYRPHWLYTDATHLRFLVDKMSRLGVRRLPSVRAVLLTYTRATAAAKRGIREFFGPRVPVTEVVSMSELGWIAMECPHGRLHLNTESFFAELGESGELLLTTIGDQLSPHIRYGTGDMYSLYDTPCKCGARSQSVRLEGRVGECLRGAGGSLLWPRMVDEIVGDPVGLLAYRVHQAESGNVEFSYLITGPAPDGEAIGSICARLSSRLGGCQVSARCANYLPAQRSGKFISCTRA
jgi:phenylacetate-CoA ligase